MGVLRSEGIWRTVVSSVLLLLAVLAYKGKAVADEQIAKLQKVEVELNEIRCILQDQPYEWVRGMRP